MEPRKHEDTKKSFCLLLVISLIACNRSSLVFQQPATLTNNLVVLPTRVNGSQELPFILDTGASATVIDRRQAGNLGLSITPGADVSTGGGNVEASQIKGVTLKIGDLSLPDLNVVAIDLAGLSAGLGQPIAGILGYDVFQRYVVEIDYAPGLVSFHEPARYVPVSGGEIIPIDIEEQTPFVRVSILGLPDAPPPAKIEFDTGKTGALTLVREFVDAYPPRPGYRRVAITAGALLPGQVPAFVTRIQGLQLGRFTVDDVVTTIVPDREAAGVAGTTVGILGGEALKRFRVVIDYSRSRVILFVHEPDAAPFEFDMSGISLTAQGPDYRDYVVRSVIPESAAAGAGVAGGDHLTAIDGKPARELTLDQIRQLFRKDGQPYALDLRRGDATIRVELRTRRLL